MFTKNKTTSGVVIDTADIAKENKRGIFASVAMIAGSLMLTALLIVFVFQLYEVSGQSMERNFHDQDRLVIWKVPRTIARVTGHSYIPSRGDVVIVDVSQVPELQQEDVSQIVKRVIGLPGERVVVNSGVLTVYNSDNPQGFQPDKTMLYGKNANVSDADADVDVTLQPGQIFICGDNRNFSYDSRAMGPIQADRIIGRATLRVYPFSMMGRP